MKLIPHQLYNQPYFIPSWQVRYLFLGTFNPLGGETVPYFYGRSSNTWKILSEIFGEDLLPWKSVPNQFMERINLLGIACMDMIASVSAPEGDLPFILGKGYSDSKIINNHVQRNYNTSKVLEVIKKNPGVQVFTTWGKGSCLNEWVFEINKIPQKTNLVSPSPMARVPKGEKKYDYMFKDWKIKINPFVNA